MEIHNSPILIKGGSKTSNHVKSDFSYSENRHLFLKTGSPKI